LEGRGDDEPPPHVVQSATPSATTASAAHGDVSAQLVISAAPSLSTEKGPAWAIFEEQNLLSASPETGCATGDVDIAVTISGYPHDFAISVSAQCVRPGFRKCATLCPYGP
jgi:hypothetical protein